MKDTMFQYTTRHKVLVDTDLITLEAAVELFNKNKEDYKNKLENDEEPEMAIWINCSDSCSYGDTLEHWCSSEFKVFDGRLYNEV